MRGALSLKRLMYKTKGFVKKESPTILTVAGAIGVVTTSVLTGKATVKAVDILKRAEEKKGEKLTKKEVVKTAIPVYIPAIISGVTTMACIFGSNVLNKRQQAALMSAYGVLDKAYSEYKDKVEELYGEEVESQIREEIAKDKYTGEEVKDDGEAKLFFDEYANRWFWKTLEEVKEAEYHFNRNFILRGYSELNEFYTFLGLEPTPYGATVGWSVYAGEATYGYNWVDFYHEFHPSTDDRTPDYYTIYMPFHPHPDFMDY